jgi:hypothetical protein
MDKDGVVTVWQKATDTRVESRLGADSQKVITTTKVEFDDIVFCVKSKEIQVFGRDGKQVDPKALRELLKKETAVLVTLDGERPNLSYLKTLKEGTLVLVFPKPSTSETPSTKEAKKVLLFTPYDQPLAEALREGEAVGTIVLSPTRGVPSRYEISDIETLNGQSPQPGTYHGEGLCLRIKPRLHAAGYFPESLYQGARISDIKFKGVFQAKVERLPQTPGPHEGLKPQKFMACEAAISPYSKK